MAKKKGGMHKGYRNIPPQKNLSLMKKMKYLKSGKK